MACSSLETSDTTKPKCSLSGGQCGTAYGTTCCPGLKCTDAYNGQCQ